MTRIHSTPARWLLGAVLGLGLAGAASAAPLPVAAPDAPALAEAVKGGKYKGGGHYGRHDNGRHLGHYKQRRGGYGYGRRGDYGGGGYYRRAPAYGYAPGPSIGIGPVRIQTGGGYY